MLWSQQLELYLGVYQKQLRYFTPDGRLMPTPEEFGEQETQRAKQEAQRADQEAQRAKQEKQEKERLAAKLRELGIGPDTL